MPTYSEVLKTYPKDADLCDTGADVTEVDADKNRPLSGTISIQLTANSLEFVVRCYGTKITLKVSDTIDGKTYPPRTKLTVDKDLNWIEVSSWD
jgi:hypothetical protein